MRRNGNSIATKKAGSGARNTVKEVTKAEGNRCYETTFRRLRLQHRVTGVVNNCKYMHRIITYAKTRVEKKCGMRNYYLRDLCVTEEFCQIIRI